MVGVERRVMEAEPASVLSLMQRAAVPHRLDTFVALRKERETLLALL